MNNFEFYTPTRVIFGKDTHLQVGKIVAEYGFQKVLVHFGGARAKKERAFDAVCGALEAENIPYVLLGGGPGQSDSVHGEGGHRAVPKGAGGLCAGCWRRQRDRFGNWHR